MRVRVAVLAVVLATIVSYEVHAAAGVPYSASHFALELGGQHQGFLKSVEGGAAFGDVVEEPGGNLPYVKKHLGNLGYDDIIIEVAPTAGSELFSWISATLSSSPKARQNGAIIAIDFNNKEVGRLVFSDAAITELTIPAADAASNTPASLRIRITPGTTESQNGSGQPFQGTVKLCKAALSSNYQVLIDGLDATRVSKVDAIVITIPRIDQPRVATKIDFPELSLVTGAASADSWDEWYVAFCINGENGDSQERNGSLTFLSPDLNSALLEVSFKGLGIFKLASVPQDSSAIARVRADLYVEQITVTGHPCQ